MGWQPVRLSGVRAQGCTGLPRQQSLPLTAVDALLLTKPCALACQAQTWHLLILSLFRLCHVPQTSGPNA